MLPKLPAEGQSELAVLCDVYEQTLQTGPEEFIQQATTAIIDCVEKWQEIKANNDKLVSNERRKSSATFLTGMAITVFGAGVATPLIGAMLPGSLLADHPWQLGEIEGVCILTAVILHLAARRLLGGLRA